MSLVFYNAPSSYFNYKNFNNPSVLNIFSDASITNESDGSFSSCYGAEAYCGESLIDSDYRVCKDTTVNDSEIKGLRLAVGIALIYRWKFPTINIFSDSQISIYGIRDRILKWNVRENKLVGSKNKPISNQSIYIEIMRIIVDNDLHVNFYHQKGHVGLNSYDNMLNAANVFSISNSVLSPIDMDFISYISSKNSSVDNNTREILKKYTGEKCIDALYFVPYQFSKYRNQYKNIRRLQDDL